jgi:hypothetical protein
MGEKELRRLRAEGVIEKVEPDAETARQELDAARRHLVSATLIADDDPAAAFTVGYDAMRKAISAHLRNSGYRVTKGTGHHHRTGQYAMAALEHLDVADRIEAFDDLRQLRNQSEYDALMVGPAEVAEMLAHARALVTGISDDLAI